MSNTKLVWITPEAENLITYIARVSNPKNQQNQLACETPEKMNTRLIRYLVKNKHWSPFEMASACFEINTTRAISAQIIRHRSFSYQEFSQRYASIDELPEINFPEIRYKGTNNRQSSLTKDKAGISDSTNDAALDIQKTTLETAYKNYSKLLKLGVAPESARMILPLSSPTRLYMSGTIRSWIHYCEIRNDKSHVQKEHQQIADEIQQQLEIKLPTIFGALDYAK